MTNKIIVSVDKIKGEVKTSAKKTEYLDGGTMHIGKDNVRVSWIRPDKDMIDKGGLFFVDLEVSHNPNNGNNYPQLNISGAVPVATDNNAGYLQGKVVEVKEMNKLVAAKFRYKHTGWDKVEREAEVDLKVFDKSSAVGKALIAAAGGGEQYVECTLLPSNGFISFVATKIMSVGGRTAGEGDIDLGTAGDVPTPPAEEEPF